MKAVSIDKETINSMPRVSFNGRIHVISSISQVKSAVAALRTASLVGFDTETRPCFKRGQRHNVALIQLSTDTDAFLFRVNMTGLPEPLKDFLEDPECHKVGLSTNDDIHQISRLTDFHPAGFLEIQQLVKEFEITDLSLQKVYAILFQEKISKSQQLSNWEAPHLTEQQQSYAAIDAWACLRIYMHLKQGRFIPEASPYYHELAV